MKFRRKKNSKNTLSLDRENFAVLKYFSSGKSIYEFSYAVNTKSALERGGQTVEISIKRSNLPKSPSIFSLNAISKKPSPVLLAQNIQQITSVEKDSKNANVNAVFASGLSDFTAQISNDSLFSNAISKKFNLATAPSLTQLSQIEPILQMTTFPSASVNQSINSLAINSILKSGEDPSDIQQQFTIGSAAAMQGFISPAQNRNTFSSEKLKISQKILSQAKITSSDEAPNTAIIPIFAQEKSGFVVVKKEFTIEIGQLANSSDFLVDFKLIGKNGLVLEAVQRKVEHSQNVRIIQTPTVPPKVTSITLPARNLLTITQQDPLATSVDIFRRDFKRTIRIEDQKYVFITNVVVSKSGGPVPFEDLVGNASNTIYRIIPKGEQGQVGHAFTNKVVKAYNFGLSRERTARLLYAGIVAQSSEKGVKIEVIGLAPGVTAIKLLARDRTNRNTAFRNVPSFLGKNLTVMVNDSPQSYLFLDQQAKDNHIIEYAVKLLFANGDEEISTTREIFRKVPFSIGAVETVMSQPRVLQSGNSIDIQFSINSTIKSSNASILRDLLQKQGQSDLFAAEMANEKTSLDNLIAHQVRRIDLSTGQTDFFRPFTGVEFSDEDNRTIDSISAPLPGRAYRYVVSALLRTPETLFENNPKTITNSIGVSVSALPLKFKHPVVGLYGNIVTPESLIFNHSESPFEFGNVGNFVSKDVSIDISKPKAFNARVSKFNKDTNIVRWTISGDKNLIDHFLIIVDKFGDQDIIGKVHTTFSSNVIEFIDKITPKEPGSYRYKIIPVQKDYTHGSSVTTQEII